MGRLIEKINNPSLKPAPISDYYGAELRSIITQMLEKDRHKRPSINQLIFTPYIQRCISKQMANHEDPVPFPPNESDKTTPSNTSDPDIDLETYSRGIVSKSPYVNVIYSTKFRKSARPHLTISGKLRKTAGTLVDCFLCPTSRTLMAPTTAICIVPFVLRVGTRRRS